MSGAGDDRHLKPASRLVRGGRRAEWTGPVVNPPVWRASTHLYASDAERQAAGGNNADGQFFYGRRGAPTQWALADALTGLEPQAHGTVLYPSGVAAVAGVMLAVLKPGDRLLMADNAYDPTRSMATGLLARLGVETTFFDPRDLDGFAALVAGARGVWLEAPGSLTFEMCDVPAIAALARDAGAVTMIDNTWASPLGFAALDRGCDIVMMSLSKHVGGHSDLMMGSASAGKRWYAALRRVSHELGQVVSPDDAALAARGLRTMGVRLEAQTRSALRIAQWLEAQPQIARVLCPMLPSDPGHELWRRDFTGGCGLFACVLASDDPAASARVADALQMFGIGYSWGGFESLALPIRPADYRSVMPATDGAPALRLSIGLEDEGDLIADLAQALAQV
ncbi:cystathionine beta-lyase [Erythrobacter neustonensis]|uniref:Cystathionine beta-lyase n=1 Tax=Erythrobacter neustonensis TaxID=1112 RepID=A0A192D594_9SPHN|nr:cystathionine beta-lyase [Erythrobacter neustonensis]ANK13067.1 cystathionine beta-lyase [Erythrobacter neustonensis]